MAMKLPGIDLPAKVKTVYYTGTDQLDEGYCLCYDADNGTAASIDQDRTFNVEKPSTTNCRWFAGTVAQKPPTAGPCFVQINEPGSVCNVYAKVNATIDSTRMTVCAGQYYMYRAGFPGRGTARALQTVDRSSTPGLIQAQLEEGEESGGVETITPPSTGATGTVMTTGLTYLEGTVTIGTGDHVLTLGDGLYPGMKKGFICLGTYTTNDAQISVTHHITSDPETFEMDTANQAFMLMWDGGANWQTIYGSALAT